MVFPFFSCTVLTTVLLYSLDNSFISQCLELHLEFAFRQVLQEVVSGIVGRRADGGSDDEDVDKSQMFLSFLVEDVSDQISIGTV